MQNTHLHSVPPASGELRVIPPVHGTLLEHRPACNPRVIPKACVHTAIYTVSLSMPSNTRKTRSQSDARKGAKAQSDTTRKTAVHGGASSKASNKPGQASSSMAAVERDVEQGGSAMTADELKLLAKLMAKQKGQQKAQEVARQNGTYCVVVQDIGSKCDVWHSGQTSESERQRWRSRSRSPMRRRRRSPSARRHGRGGQPTLAQMKKIKAVHLTRIRDNPKSARVLRRLRRGGSQARLISNDVCSSLLVLYCMDVTLTSANCSQATAGLQGQSSTAGRT